MVEFDRGRNRGGGNRPRSNLRSKSIAVAEFDRSRNKMVEFVRGRNQGGRNLVKVVEMDCGGRNKDGRIRPRSNSRWLK